MTVLDTRTDLVRSWCGDAGWADRLRADRDAVGVLLPTGLQALHETIVSRARLVRANALILTGSTARGRRTEISDLDYHLIGPRIETRDLVHELDLHVLSSERLEEEEILAGDDVVQWSLRFGRVVFDDGVLRRALHVIADRRPWPDLERKRQHATKSLALAGRVVETGDQDGALLQARTALSLGARAFLLSRGTFPLARAELPAQLADAGRAEASEALRASIEEDPTLDALASAVGCAGALLAEIDDRHVTR